MLKLPGVMIYNDTYASLALLSDSEVGRLVRAMMTYAETGEQPKFGGRLAMAWSYSQPKLDRDMQRYNETVEQRRYAVFVREQKKQGLEAPSYAEWKTLLSV